MTSGVKTVLPRKWDRPAPGHMCLEHEAYSFDARDLGVVDEEAGWRLECSGPDGSTTFIHLKNFAAVKERAAEWYEAHA